MMVLAILDYFLLLLKNIYSLHTDFNFSSNFKDMYKFGFR